MNMKEMECQGYIYFRAIDTLFHSVRLSKIKCLYTIGRMCVICNCNSKHNLAFSTQFDLKQYIALPSCKGLSSSGL